MRLDEAAGMKPNNTQSQAETLMITRALARMAQKLRKKDLSRTGAARSARTFLEDLRELGMVFPGAAFEEPPCAECLDTSLFLAENSLRDFESFLLGAEPMPDPRTFH